MHAQPDRASGSDRIGLGDQPGSDRSALRLAADLLEEIRGIFVAGPSPGQHREQEE
jgi:hypothetical protein